MSEERKHELLVRWMDGEFLEPEDQRELEVILEAEPEVVSLVSCCEGVVQLLAVSSLSIIDISERTRLLTKSEQALRDANKPI